MAETFAIEFNEAEIEKLKQIADNLKAAAGQNENLNELADWLSSVVNEDAEAEATPDAPKRKTKK